ncbi:lytic murein transglycosylase [Novosphingobium sp. FSY-8]|uniref:Lytic murein transglycosylase n=1 Tax=Novosphingobium ovatum TaxID=1908523 RepID=A0ABW9XCH0_9SPHN|nr:lytic murein transglycosylase [Novosphingobium ovatum]
MAQEATVPAPAPAFTPVTAPSAEEAGFAGYVQVLAARARAAGVSEATIQRMTTGLAYDPRVIALDRSQPGSSPTAPSPPFEPYRASHVNASRIARGRAIYAALSADIARIEAKYGVPAPILMAIWGQETDYGGGLGRFDLARSLATLAYEGRRRELFATEFVALLQMVDRGVPRDLLVGSWAGAFGWPQFLPSVYLRVAQDADGDGIADIWRSRVDTLASIGAYFREAGWKPGRPWAVRAAVPEGFDRASIVSRLESPRCPRVHARHSVWKTVAEWRALGVVPMGQIGENELASLFEPDGPGNPAFLLTGNYRVILDYNCSNYYALSVGLLADEIAR